MEEMPLELETLDQTAFDQFMAALRIRYVHDRERSNLLSTQEAEQFTDQQWASILPDGRNTEGHHFFKLVDSGRRIGASWVFIDAATDAAFIYELFLEEDERGKGFGRKALDALQQFSKSQGAKTLALNVFANNLRARKLYDSFGFAPVSTDMIKPI